MQERYKRHAHDHGIFQTLTPSVTKNSTAHSRSARAFPHSPRLLEFLSNHPQGEEDSIDPRFLVRMVGGGGNATHGLLLPEEANRGSFASGRGVTPGVVAGGWMIDVLKNTTSRFEMLHEDA